MRAANVRAILGVSEDADEASVRAAWRKMAKRWHPDLNPDDPQARTRFEAARAAYQDFVRARAASASVHATSPFRRADTVAAARAAAAPVDLALSVRDLIAGTQTFIAAPLGGTARLRVPPASRPGDELIARTPSGGAVRARLSIDPADDWRVDGAHIRGVRPIPPAAGPGGDWMVWTPHGAIKVRVPDAARPGAILRLKGRGLPARELSAAGDLMIELAEAAPEAAPGWLSRARDFFRRHAA